MTPTDAPVPTLATWQASTPALTGAAEADSTALADHVLAGERLLAQLPSPQDRSGQQGSIATEIHLNCRRLRTRFLRSHVEHVYDMVTKGRRRRLRLAELALAAADAFPGLLPDAGQLAEERDRPQAAKEGREIDQGVFFHAVLGHPGTGNHLIETMLRPTDRALALRENFQQDGVIDLGTVHMERRNDAAYLTVRNGQHLNSEDNGLIDDMETAVDIALLDDGVRVGVLRGGEMTHPRYLGKRVFSAGINLKQLHAGGISYPDFLLRRELGYINKIQRGLLIDDTGHAWPRPLLDKPWLAAVDTFAIGGGAQLLLVFDHVIAAADAYFSLPAAQEGIVPGVANLRLGRIGGDRLARQVILGGRKVWATESCAERIFDEVVDPREMDGAIERAASRLAAPAVVANRRMLNLAAEPPDRFREYVAEFAREQAIRMYSPDVLDKVANAWSAPPAARTESRGT